MGSVTLKPRRLLLVLLVLFSLNLPPALSQETPPAPVRAIALASGPSLLAPASHVPLPTTAIPSLRAARKK